MATLAPWQIDEVRKCAADPAYFIETYCKIRHPAHGIIPFHLHTFQKTLLQNFEGYQNNVVNKSRQTGISTLTAAYCLWILQFRKHQEVIVISRRDDEAMSFVDKVKLAWDELPSWLRVPKITDSQHILVLATHSKIKAEAKSKNAGRSASLNLLVIDEAAHIDVIRHIWKSAGPTLSRGHGKCIQISTPNGMGNLFHETVEGAKKEGTPEWNGFKFTFCHWRDVPEYDDAWYRIERRKYTDQEWAQEYEGDFLGSGLTVVPPEHLRAAQAHLANPSTFLTLDMRESSAGEVWVWELPRPGNQYIIGADTATGNGEDFSAAEVFCLNSGEQVAEYRGKNLPPKRFAKMLADLGHKYNDAYIVPENNGPGILTCDELYNAQSYWNIYLERNPQTNKINFRKPGFRTTVKTRPVVIEGVKQIFDPDGMWTIRSHRLFAEATTFVWIEKRAEAEKTYTDDMIMSAGIAGGSMTQATLDNPLAMEAAGAEDDDRMRPEDAEGDVYGGEGDVFGDNPEPPAAALFGTSADDLGVPRGRPGGDAWDWGGDQQPNYNDIEPSRGQGAPGDTAGHFDWLYAAARREGRPQP